MEDVLRYAIYEDMELLFEWANDKEVRRNSFSSHSIAYDEHRDWYERLLQRTDAKQYIFLHSENAVGQIRVETQGDIGMISYSICRECRGMGYGTKMLQLLAEYVKKDFPCLKKLQGRVKKENSASQSAFQKAGFRAVHQLHETPLLYERLLMD